MTNVPSLTGKRLMKKLESIGFVIVRVRGSHYFLRHTDGRATVVPVHGNETIGVGLLHKILRDCELTTDDILAK